MYDVCILDPAKVTFKIFHGNKVANIIPLSIKRGLQKLLDWDLIKKSQLILFYAIFLELGLFAIQLNYLKHPLVNQPFLTEILWFIPGVIVINLVLIFIGQLIKKQTQYHGFYTCFVLSFYFSCLLFLHMMVGLLNLANGVVFVGTILASLFLFPIKIIGKIIWGYALTYLFLVYLTVNGYIDYALAFTPNALIHPRLEGIYVTFSIVYTMFYIGLILVVGNLLIQTWKDQVMYRRVECYSDPLTKILNETAIKKISELQLSQAYITGSELSVVVLDIDNLKRLNHDFGHESGDIVLLHLASVLRKNLRSSDMIAREGGGTFILILAFTPLERAQAVSEMCRLAIEQTVCVLQNERRIHVKASFGVSSTAQQDFDFDRLLTAAKNAMQHAKYNGKNQVCSTDMLSQS